MSDTTPRRLHAAELDDVETDYTGTAGPNVSVVLRLVVLARERDAEIERLRAALHEIADTDKRRAEFVMMGPRAMAIVVRIAKEALGETT